MISFLVPLIIAIGLPRLLSRHGFKSSKKQLSWLHVACLLFAVSWYLPSPLIDGQDTSFVTHFVGGGMFSGLVWIYLKLVIGLKSKWYIEAFSLFALVSALGCVNEIFELVLVQAKIATININETNWDILANSLGSLIVYLVYIAYDSRN